jgi:GNAT superfamily N-acetyltransferase
LPAIRQLLEQPEIGKIPIFRHQGEAAGYLVATTGFSIEFGGRFVLLDELFILPAFRGRGLWKAGLAEIERWAAAIHASCIRLEVNHHNKKARATYLKAGFIDDRRDLLTKWISRPADK